MFWPDWQDQKMRQHQTTFIPQDLALLGLERDLSMICQKYMTLKLSVKMLGYLLGSRFVWLICFGLVAGYQEGRIQCKTRMSKEG